MALTFDKISEISWSRNFQPRSSSLYTDIVVRDGLCYVLTHSRAFSDNSREDDGILAFRLSDGVGTSHQTRVVHSVANIVDRFPRKMDFLDSDTPADRRFFVLWFERPRSGDRSVRYRIGEFPISNNSANAPADTITLTQADGSTFYPNGPNDFVYDADNDQFILFVTDSGRRKAVIFNRQGVYQSETNLPSQINRSPDQAIKAKDKFYFLLEDDDRSLVVLNSDFTFDENLAMPSLPSGTIFHRAIYFNNNTFYSVYGRYIYSAFGERAAPSKITTLKATAGNTAVMLEWEEPASPDAEILRYEYEIDDSGTWIDTGSLDTEINITGLSNGQAYSFKVRAVNVIGAGDESAAATATPKAGRPSAITDLKAQGIGHGVLLSWTAPNNGGNEIIRYEYMQNDGAWTDTGSLDTTFEILGLTENVTYSFKVRAVNSAGNGPDSNEASATATGAPDDMGQLVVVQTPTDKIFHTRDGIRLVRSEEEQYVRDESGRFYPARNQLGLSAIEYVLVRGVAYEARDRIVDFSAISTLTHVSSGHANPDIIRLNNGKVKISWDKVGGAVHYQYRYSWQHLGGVRGTADRYTQWRLADVKDPENPSITLDDIAKPCWVHIRAVNAAGHGRENVARPVGIDKLREIQGFTVAAQDSGVVFTWKYDTYNYAGFSNVRTLPISQYRINRGQWITMPFGHAISDVHPSERHEFLYVSISGFPDNHQEDINTFAGGQLTGPTALRKGGVYRFTQSLHGLRNGTEYTIQIRYRAYSESVYEGRVEHIVESEELTVTPSADAVDPNVPTGLGVPTQVQNLIASAGNGFVALTWSAATSVGSLITHYEYQIGDGAWISTGDTDTSFAIGSLNNGQEYLFRVRAVNSEGAGPASAQVSATPVADVPLHPINIVSKVVANSIEYSWDAPHDGGSPIIRYEYLLQHSATTTFGGGVSWLSTGSANPRFIATGLQDGFYWFQVRAVNAIGHSDESSVKLDRVGDPAVPDKVSNLSATQESGRTTLSWDAPFDGGSTILRYEIQQDNGAWTSIGSDNTAFIVENLDNGIEYTFRVRAVNAVGNGEASDEVDITPAAPVLSIPGQVLGLVALPLNGEVRLVWNPAASGNSPIIRYEYQQGDGTWTSIGSANTEFIVRNLTNDQTYSFRVRAVNVIGNGPASDPVSATPSITTTTPTREGLPYAGKVPIAGLPVGHTIVGAVANQNNIFVLSDNGTDNAQIHTFDYNAIVLASVNAYFDADNVGLDAVGTGFVFANKDDSGQMEARVVSNTGAAISTLEFFYRGQDFFGRVVETAYEGTPYAIFYNDTTREYIVVNNEDSRDNFSIDRFDEEGVHEEALTPPTNISRAAAMTRSATQYWVIEQPNGRRANILNNTFLDSGQGQTFEALGSRELIRAFAFARNQLIVITDEYFHFYGEPPAPPRETLPVKQLELDSDFYENFDIVRDGNPIANITTNARMIRQTATEFADVASDIPIDQQLQNVEIVPEWTVPDAREGDKIFLNTTGDTDPDTIPSEETLTIVGFIFTGDKQRQVFVCTID